MLQIQTKTLWSIGNPDNMPTKNRQNTEIPNIRVARRYDSSNQLGRRKKPEENIDDTREISGRQRKLSKSQKI